MSNLNLFFSVNDISGNAYSPSGSWTVNATFDNLQYGSGATVTSVSGQAGYYQVEIVNPVGDGVISLVNSDTSAFISPDFYAASSTTLYTEDDVYAKLLRYDIDDLTLSVQKGYEEVIFDMKAGDDKDIEYVIPDAVTTQDISGWTFSAQLRDSTSTTTSGSSALIGALTVTVLDIPTRMILISIPAAYTENIIPEGDSQITLLSDLQAVTLEGKKKTIAEFAITVNRQFTYG